MSFIIPIQDQTLHRHTSIDDHYLETRVPRNYVSSLAHRQHPMPCPLVSGAQSETEFLHIKLQGTTGLLDSPAHLKRGVRDVVFRLELQSNTRQEHHPHTS